MKEMKRDRKKKVKWAFSLQRYDILYQTIPIHTTCAWIHVMSQAVPHTRDYLFINKNKERRKRAQKAPIDCLSSNASHIGWVFYEIGTSFRYVCRAVMMPWNGMGWWGELMMRMCKEFDFMNECDRVQKMWMFISIYGTRKQYSYSTGKKIDGCCTHFIDRFYRETFPIQMNGFAIAVIATAVCTTVSVHVRHFLLVLSWIYPLHL